MNLVEPEDDKPLEAKNIIFNGSLAVDGTCIAVVIRVGDSTLIGGIFHLQYSYIIIKVIKLIH